jgi:hypothetical protein
MNKPNEKEEKSVKGFLKLLWGAYTGVYQKYPALFVIGNVGILFALPIDWVYLYDMGVVFFAKIRGMLGV